MLDTTIQVNGQTIYKSWNKLLDRCHLVDEIVQMLNTFEKDKHNLLIHRGIYIYGNSGTGKSAFIYQILSELGYDIIKYDAGDVRNKSIIDMITKHNMADKNVLSMVTASNTMKKIAIIIDEIDGMNSGDKGGINSLIKMVRPKRTKKQKQEDYSLNPVICIGNYHQDKKIKELMKACCRIELKSPTQNQMLQLVRQILPTHPAEQIIDFLQGDLRKLRLLTDFVQENQSGGGGVENLLTHSFKKTYNEDTRQITQRLITQPYKMEDHFMVMNETDRTIVGLLWHENIIDVIKNSDFALYKQFLDNICYADYMDRITFQKQIWQFNELSSLMKTFHNNYLLHQHKKNSVPHVAAENIRFTKILTKYSTEYGNSVFIQQMCQRMGMDKKDMMAYFLYLRMADMGDFDDTINKLDVRRIYRYLDYISNNKREIMVDLDDDDNNNNININININMNE